MGFLLSYLIFIIVVIKSIYKYYFVMNIDVLLVFRELNVFGWMLNWSVFLNIYIIFEGVFLFVLFYNFILGYNIFIFFCV